MAARADDLWCEMVPLATHVSPRRSSEARAVPLHHAGAERRSKKPSNSQRRDGIAHDLVGIASRLSKVGR